MTGPTQFIKHGQWCHICKGSDGPKTMCRIGRRLYMSWFESQDKDTQMMSLMGMPDDMRDEVIAAAGLEGLVVVPAKPQ